MTDPTATTILDAVDRHGVLLVHDQVLVSVTSLVAGEPVKGSWWSHPMGKAIYNALGAIEEQVVTVKLIAGKQTLVARRLWPELVAVGAAGDPWQLSGLDEHTQELLATITSGSGPVVVDKAQRKAAELLERRLLVHVTDIHTGRGHHVKGYEDWAAWAAERAVVPAADSASARATFEAAVRALAPDGRVARLPW